MIDSLDWSGSCAPDKPRASALAAKRRLAKPGPRSNARYFWGRALAWLAFTLCALLLGCSDGSPSGARAKPGAIAERTCNVTSTTDTASLRYLDTLECMQDFQTLASLPLDVTIPGVRAAKFVIDRLDISQGELGRLYFQNSQMYAIHSEFVQANIRHGYDSSNFSINYYGNDDSRQFYLGSISYYEESQTWALEMAPYDTATPAIIEKIYQVITEQKAYFRPALAFHPTSEAQLLVAKQVSSSIPVITSDELYAKTDYQPLTKAKSMGLLTFLTAADVSSGTFIPYYSIVVLDEAPNDITVVSGIITEQFQSVLSHVNVLSTNRGTPNMGLRNARTNAKLLEYKDQWVELDVAADAWTIQPVSAQEGMAYYEAHKPAPVTLPALDLATTAVVDVREMIPDYLTVNADASSTKETLRDKIKLVVNAYGGKTANYAVMSLLDGFPIPRAFGIPVHYYDLFMQENGYYERVRGYLQNKDVLTGETIAFMDDPAVRQEALRDLRNSMMKGKIDQGLQDELKARLARDYTNPDGTPVKMRFRTSTNSEDLDAFPCAGCYESHTGDPANWESVLDAIRLTYTSTWLFRTFEERSYYGVDHESVGMALLVHGYFPDETANGVAITANPFDLTQSNAEAYFINTAYGGAAEVVHLPVGVTTDQFLYYVGASGNNTVYVSRSNQRLPDGRTSVLNTAEVGQLVAALTTIKDTFRKAYATTSWYAMDVEWKFAPQNEWGSPTKASTLWIKQARPYPNPND
ncbi:MAG: PEP/pyruvate-binding domain-containing protein [Polyangiaceae bacterium]